MGIEENKLRWHNAAPRDELFYKPPACADYMDQPY